LKYENFVNVFFENYTLLGVLELDE